ncbi:hypothetical protein FPZ42_07090 [Mucilaginibacter achroorhodeus]|uniref:Lipoprotein n=1 Tax=Mucilaginibacter achroorhodeus TaxID=2599294 RepID=A0A563U610_9SPHI|nr:hypothetical protein [Mucilaginibacter achroorhodeus]TWR26796.1 hypothetical protein FPZ42_07090 [Mucilaginibacter achroorhodeus]
MKHIYKLLAGVALATTAYSCGGKSELFPDLYGKDRRSVLTDFNDVKNGGGKAQKAAPAMYVDFSAGMYTAFGAGNIKQLMAQSFNIVLEQQFSVFKLVQDEVTPITVANSTELGQIVNDPKQYLDRRAPIQVAVEQIVNGKSDALLITDFEEFQNGAEVTSTAYLKISFSKWLHRGNSISFFIADYKEGKIDKHIYFTVFNYGRPTEKSLISKLRPVLSALPAKFDLSAEPYVLKTEYPEPGQGGIFRDEKAKDMQHQNVLDLQPSFFSAANNNNPFEYYPLGVDWETIAQAKKEYSSSGQFKDMFRKLFVDLSNIDSYEIEGLDVRAYDATNDFERYAKCVEASKHKPRIIKGGDGEQKIADNESDEIALNCYNSDGTIKAEYKYEPIEQPLINGVFGLNQALFMNTSHDDRSKTEIGLSLADDLQGLNSPGSNRLVRVVINISKVKVNTTNTVMDKFRWINADGIANTALYESVRNTLDDLRPVNKTIFTYYIKTAQ